MKTMNPLLTETLLEETFLFDRYPLPADSTHVVEAQPDSRLVFITDPEGLAVEQYRMLRRRLEERCPAGGVVLVTSPGPSEGKTLTSLNLAWCFADSGEAICLVEMDFRAAGLTKTLGVPFTQDGLEEVLRGTHPIEGAVCRVEGTFLDVLAVKEPTISPARFLMPKQVLPFLTELRSKYRWVVLDLPPTVPFADVAEVLPFVDGALLVVRAGKTRKSLLSGPVAILGDKLWGVVLNDVPVEGGSYYGYYGALSKK